MALNVTGMTEFTQCRGEEKPPQRDEEGWVGIGRALSQFGCPFPWATRVCKAERELAVWGGWQESGGKDR